MAKTFSVVKRINLATGEETVARYASLPKNDEKKKSLLRKLNNLLPKEEKDLFSFRFDEVLEMHVLQGLSEKTVEELSKHVYSTVFAVCKKRQNGEDVLYLNVFKDGAIRYKSSLPGAIRESRGRETTNPKYFVKEVKLIV